MQAKKGGELKSRDQIAKQRRRQEMFRDRANKGKAKAKGRKKA